MRRQDWRFGSGIERGRVWLAPLDDAGVAGVALLRSEVGGTSSVTVVLAKNAESGAGATEDHGHEATPEATPAVG